MPHFVAVRGTVAWNGSSILRSTRVVNGVSEHLKTWYNVQDLSPAIKTQCYYVHDFDRYTSKAPGHRASLGSKCLCQGKGEGKYHFQCLLSTQAVIHNVSTAMAARGSSWAVSWVLGIARDSHRMHQGLADNSTCRHFSSLACNRQRW